MTTIEEALGAMPADPVDIKDVAKRLGVTHESLKRRAGKDFPKVFRISARRWVVEAADLITWASDSRTDLEAAAVRRRVLKGGLPAENQSSGFWEDS